MLDQCAYMFVFVFGVVCFYMFVSVLCGWHWMSGESWR